MKSNPFSLAYLSSHRCKPQEALKVAADTGYQFVGMRLWPNAVGAVQQHLIDRPQDLKETLAAQKDTGIGVFDLEIIRIGESFDAHHWDALYEIGARLQAKAILVAGDDKNLQRLAENYANLCAVMKPYGMTADLEFMPWTAVPDAKTAMQIVEQAGSPANAGILIDALHMARSNTSLEDILAIPKTLLHYAQICDAQAGTHFSTEQMIHTARCARELPGRGNINLRGLLDCLPAGLPISIEVVNFEQENGFSPTEWALRCRQFSQPYFDWNNQ
jgi:sugar phosphate isomerase/epimerase